MARFQFFLNHRNYQIPLCTNSIYNCSQNIYVVHTDTHHTFHLYCSRSDHKLRNVNAWCRPENTNRLVGIDYSIAIFASGRNVTKTTTTTITKKKKNAEEKTTKKPKYVVAMLILLTINQHVYRLKIYLCVYICMCVRVYVQVSMHILCVCLYVCVYISFIFFLPTGIVSGKSATNILEKQSNVIK